MAKREMLIIGATGQQGKATIAALCAAAPESPPVRILALTRSALSPKSLALKKDYPGVELVEGNTNNPEAVFLSYPNIAAVFLVTLPPDEEAQAVPLIEAACMPNRRVDHIVFNSVDRGGNDASWDNPTPVPHFAAKHRIEKRLRAACEGAARHIRWTILRPTGFMDNYQPGAFGSMMTALWSRGLPSDRKMHLVSTHDIGVFAAKALLNPEAWSGRAVGLAGDEMTAGQAKEVFRRVVGRDMPASWGVVATAVLWSVKEARTSFEWFDRVGYSVDIESLRREEPGLQTFEMWLRESSGWKDEIGSKNTVNNN